MQLMADGAAVMSSAANVCSSVLFPGQGKLFQSPKEERADPVLVFHTASWPDWLPTTTLFK